MKLLQVSKAIQLKPLEETDAALIFQTIDRDRTYLEEWLPFVPFTQTEEDSLAYIRAVYATPESYREMVYCMLLEQQFVGLIGLKFNPSDKINRKTEIGYWLSEAYQKRGIVTRSVKRLLEYAFDELRLNRVQINCAVGNTKSSNIPKRLGFTFEGVTRDGELEADGSFVDIEVYSLLKQEWEHSF